MTVREAFILGCLAFGVVTHLMALMLMVRRKIRERRGIVDAIRRGGDPRPGLELIEGLQDVA